MRPASQSEARRGEATSLFKKYPFAYYCISPTAPWRPFWKNCDVGCAQTCHFFTSCRWALEPMRHLENNLRQYLSLVWRMARRAKDRLTGFSRTCLRAARIDGDPGRYFPPGAEAGSSGD